MQTSKQPEDQSETGSTRRARFDFKTKSHFSESIAKRNKKIKYFSSLSSISEFLRQLHRSQEEIRNYSSWVVVQEECLGQLSSKSIRSKRGISLFDKETFLSEAFCPKGMPFNAVRSLWQRNVMLKEWNIFRWKNTSTDSERKVRMSERNDEFASLLPSISRKKNRIPFHMKNLWITFSYNSSLSSSLCLPSAQQSSWYNIGKSDGFPDKTSSPKTTRSSRKSRAR